MIQRSPSTIRSAAAAAAAHRLRRAASRIEALEARAYLTGVVLSTSQQIAAASDGIAPIYTNLDDMNGDGKLDLITANQASGAVGNSISVLPGNGAGVFGAPQTVPLDFVPYTIAEADLNGDGKLDIVVGSATSTKVAVILQNANGTFAAATDYSTGLANTRSIALGDFNHDGRPDVAAVSDDSGASNNVDVLINGGTGTFTPQAPITVAKSQLSSVVAFTALGQTDLAIADQNSNAVTVLQGLGNGTFISPHDYAVGGAPVSIATADFNNDGRADLVTSDSTSGQVSTLLGNGDGTFAAAVNSPVTGAPAGGGPLKVRVANFNNDGLPDIVVLLGANSSADADVLLGNGDGTFHSGTTIATGAGTQTAIAAGDITGDGLTDAVIANASEVTTLVNVTNQDHTPPTAAVDITQPTPTLGAAVINFTVTYSDNTQVDASTLGNGNLTVTAPNGTTQPATLISTNLANGASVTATYQIAATSGAVGTADNGNYTVTATSNTAAAVKDANGNALPGGPIGSFAVTISSTPQNGPDLVASAVQAKLPAAAVGGTRARTPARVTITNAGNQAAVGTITVNFYASPDQTIRGNAPLLGTVTKKISLRPGKHVVVTLSRFTYPAGVNGRFFVVANVNATKAITETTYADNVGISASAATIAPPFVDLANLGVTRVPARLVVGKRLNAVVVLKNNGNVPAGGTATFSVYASPDANAADGVLLGTTGAHVGIPAGKSRNVTVRLTVPSITSGTYRLVVVVSFPGDATLANNSGASTTTFTI